MNMNKVTFKKIAKIIKQIDDILWDTMDEFDRERIQKVRKEFYNILLAYDYGLSIDYRLIKNIA